MLFSLRKSPLRGGIYHLALIIITATAFNLGFAKLTGIDVAQRVFEGVVFPAQWLAVVICVSAVIVVWSNWVD